MSEIKVNKISPETGTDVTLGDSGDTFTIPSGGIITNSGTANGFGGGKINQVIICVLKTDLASSTLNSWHDLTGLSESITPTATDSKIMVYANICMSSDDNDVFMRVVKATDTYLTNGVGDADGSRERTTSGDMYEGNGTSSRETANMILDEPATTSAVTYKIQWYMHSSGEMYCNKNNTASDTDNSASFRSISSITLMEVLA